LRNRLQNKILFIIIAIALISQYWGVVWNIRG
jgi:hypothetical protein